MKFLRLAFAFFGFLNFAFANSGTTNGNISTLPHLASVDLFHSDVGYSDILYPKTSPKIYSFYNLYYVNDSINYAGVGGLVGVSKLLGPEVMLGAYFHYEYSSSNSYPLNVIQATKNAVGAGLISKMDFKRPKPNILPFFKTDLSLYGVFTDSNITPLETALNLWFNAFFGTEIEFLENGVFTPEIGILYQFIKGDTLYTTNNIIIRGQEDNGAFIDIKARYTHKFNTENASFSPTAMLGIRGSFINNQLTIPYLNNRVVTAKYMAKAPIGLILEAGLLIGAVKDKLNISFTYNGAFNGGANINAVNVRASYKF